MTSLGMAEVANAAHGAANRRVVDSERAPWRPPSGDLSRAHHIPMRRQLAAALEAAIRDGHLPRGARLPSTRDLARRLRVDRGTVSAAYARLRRRGCVAGGPGRRTRVAWPPGLPTGEARLAGDLLPGSGRGRPPDLDELARRALAGLLGRAATRGIPRSLALDALARASSALVAGEVRAPPPVLFEPRPGLRAALAAELEWRLGLAVRAIGRPPEAMSAPTLLMRPELASRLRGDGACRRVSRRLGRLPDIVPLALAGGTAERGLVRRGVRTGVVALVSVSGTVRRYGAELAVREFERGVSFVSVHPVRVRALHRAVRGARLVLYDLASRGRLPCTSARLAPVHLLAASQVATLRAYLGSPPRAAPGDAPRDDPSSGAGAGLRRGT